MVVGQQMVDGTNPFVFNPVKTNTNKDANSGDKNKGKTNAYRNPNIKGLDKNKLNIKEGPEIKSSKLNVPQRTVPQRTVPQGTIKQQPKKISGIRRVGRRSRKCCKKVCFKQGFC